MITRKVLGLLAAVTTMCFAIAGMLGNDRHGALRVVANIAWFGFLISGLFLMVASVATIARHLRHVRA